MFCAYYYTKIFNAYDWLNNNRIYSMAPVSECLSGIACLKRTTEEIPLTVLIYFIKEQRHL